MRSERRKYIRFQAQDSTYAALGTHFSKVGKLKDISVGGLAFEYIDTPDFCECDCSKVAIFLSENGFYLPDLACKLICDSPICVMNNKSIFKPLYVLNRCAVQFTTITRHQREKLEYFLNHYTSGLAPSSQEANFSP